MLFAGPATTGSIVPNVQVKPETGNNFDVGVKFRAGDVSGGAYYFLNQYHDFIAQDLVVADQRRRRRWRRRPTTPTCASPASSCRRRRRSCSGRAC